MNKWKEFKVLKRATGGVRISYHQDIGDWAISSGELVLTHKQAVQMHKEIGKILNLKPSNNSSDSEVLIFYLKFLLCSFGLMVIYQVLR